ncbi:pfs [Verticillium alfalfae VaMs.102]|uniref:Pfs n=1 Tax=Verticillium alfalfae (strain VaMs.102 / ATCC MYA-4576 / FGSC 10136) TaxID=526221 RepID=C9SEH1_VERA1|nr:pfs [Verticillium alfalfae VaMs.102]EEY16564.1 pfs [Verticillium alfalfae VaMs.102]
MRGKAGAGKSTMMKFIYQRTKEKVKSPDTIVASFFFNARGMELEKSILGMYRSLLVQLLEQVPDLQSVLEDPEVIPINKQDCPGLNVLKELLQNAVVALGNRSFICFIDALDECDELQDIRRTWQVTSSPVWWSRIRLPRSCSPGFLKRLPESSCGLS